MNYKHGYRRHPLYRLWSLIKTRCCNPACEAYPRYGGRGITICNEWKDNFIPFRDWALTNGYEQGLEIDRINNDGNYEPTNCHFVTRRENSNNRRNNKKITAFGETKTVADWSRDRRCVVTSMALYARLSVFQFSPEKALTHPPHHNTKHPPSHLP